jgi:hypothetical protein
MCGTLVSMLTYEYIHQLLGKSCRILDVFVRIFFLVVLGISTQDFVLARQVLYCLSQASSPFCSVYFRDRVLLFCPTWTTILLFYASCYCWDDRRMLRWAVFFH